MALNIKNLNKPKTQIFCKCGREILVDKEDLSLVSHYVFSCTSRSKSVRCTHNDRTVTLGRLLLGLVDEPRHVNVDHISQNTHDNRRCNLRKATQSQNFYNTVPQSNNTSGYKGVSWHKRDEVWQAYISTDNKRIYLGYFTDINEAARTYDKAAKEIAGEFACLNFP